MKICRHNALLPFEAATDLTGMAGRFVILNAGTSKVAVVTSATVKPLGILLTDGPVGDRVTVAIGAGGLAGTVRVKVGGTVVGGPGIYLQLAADGRVVPLVAAGARTLVALSLEGGNTDELIEAVLINPQSLT